MNVIKRKIRRALAMSPSELAARLCVQPKRWIEDHYRHVLYQYTDQRSSKYNQFTLQTGIVSFSDLNIQSLDLEVTEWLLKQWIDHRFDILGSGYASWDYDAPSLGLMGYEPHLPVQNISFESDCHWVCSFLGNAHKHKSLHIWKNIASFDATKKYKPIDWQKDAKSGFRFDGKQLSSKQPIGVHPGTDIKLPWELGRMQHLPMMAVVANIVSVQPSGLQTTSPEDLIAEFRAQVLDFISMNPIGMGSQWVCAMDVGIRVANILLAYDLFKQADKSNILDEWFQDILANSVYDHGAYITKHFEYDAINRSNHYLGNIVGLVFICAYLNENHQTNRWLALAAQEILQELNYQFYEDGGNFESSTHYHRLSSEMIVYALAALEGIGKERFDRIKNEVSVPDAYRGPICQNQPKLIIDDAVYRKLDSIRHFAQSISLPNNDTVQWGDNDSGRFIQLTPTGEFFKYAEWTKLYTHLMNSSLKQNHAAFNSSDVIWDENRLNIGTLIGALQGFIEPSVPVVGFELEQSFVMSLRKNSKRFSSSTNISVVKKQLQAIPSTLQQEYVVKPHKVGESLLNGLTWHIFPKTGVYIAKSDRLWFAIHAMTYPFGTFTSHVHCDRLAVELYIDGEAYMRDPGTWVYSASVESRNAYRTASAHSAPHFEGSEPNTIYPGRNGLFCIGDEAKGELWGFCEKANRITLKMDCVGGTIYRHICIDMEQIIIRDYAKEHIPRLQPPEVLLSAGYGKLYRDKPCWERTEWLN